MCTICGIVTGAPHPDHFSQLVAMLDATRHRGPDSCGLWASEEGRRLAFAEDPEGLARMVGRMAPSQIVLAQSRLAITGGANALQPFASADGKLAFAHNGEVYNHEELRRILPDNGRPLATDSDSEVLARLVESLYAGDLAAAVRRAIGLADGMYAFAATDGETLVLARDPVGKKPLYYVEAAVFAFASERKALLPLADERGGVIKRLPPGHMLVARPGEGVLVEEVETLPVPPVDVVEMREAVDLYEAALDQSVQRRTRGIRRAAVLFSGGVDSVLVARLLQRNGIAVSAYTMGMEGSSDIEASRQVTRELGIPLRVAEVDVETLERELPRILRATEIGGPLQVEVSVPMWFASRMAHEDGHRVIFTGQGADELFAGYDWYRRLVEQQGHLELHARLWEDIRMLPEDTLEREDRITMAHQMELRAPFLDADLMRLAMRIAPQLKTYGPDDMMRKHPHREVAFRVGVPRAIAFREKIPAQEGAGVRKLLHLVAQRRFPDGAPQAEALADFGSNYRYRDTLGAYASPEVHALLAEIVREHGLHVVDEAGAIALPAREPTVRLRPGPGATGRKASLR